MTQEYFSEVKNQTPHMEKAHYVYWENSPRMVTFQTHMLVNQQTLYKIRYIMLWAKNPSHYKGKKKQKAPQ